MTLWHSLLSAMNVVIVPGVAHELAVIRTTADALVKQRKFKAINPDFTGK